MPAKFGVINDQSGDAREVTLKEWSDLQLRGYRIVDAAGYDNAMAAERDAEATAPAEPAFRSYEDGTVAMLRDEIDRRNAAGAGIEVAPDARKADLITLLEDHDAR